MRERLRLKPLFLVVVRDEVNPCPYHTLFSLFLNNTRVYRGIYSYALRGNLVKISDENEVPCLLSIHWT